MSARCVYIYFDHAHNVTGFSRTFSIGRRLIPLTKFRLTMRGLATRLPPPCPSACRNGQSLINRSHNIMCWVMDHWIKKMKKQKSKEPWEPKLLTATRWIFLIWVLFIILVVAVNFGSLLSLDMMLYAGPQICLFIASCLSLRNGGVLLLIDALVIGVVVYPLGYYGLFALIQCLLFFSGPPLLFGIVFLVYGIINNKKAQSLV